MSPFKPGEPVAPAGPVAPVAPVAPLAPAVPAGPIAPVAPLEPTAPAGPADPVGPVTPLSPLSPLIPAGPLAPVAPVAPLPPLPAAAPAAPFVIKPFASIYNCEAVIAVPSLGILIEALFIFNEPSNTKLLEVSKVKAPEVVDAKGFEKLTVKLFPLASTGINVTRLPLESIVFNGAGFLMCKE